MASPTRKVLLDSPRMQELIGKLAAEAGRLFEGRNDWALVGIRTGGAVLADRLRKALAARNVKVPLGLLDITLYRDDLTRISPHPVVRRTEIGFPIDDRPILLVDDVLFTGRTIRAALDALVDYGRPSRVALAVLVDRGGRELPIQPDLRGQAVQAGLGELVTVRFKESDGADEVAIGRPA